MHEHILTSAQHPCIIKTSSTSFLSAHHSRELHTYQVLPIFQYCKQWLGAWEWGYRSLSLVPTVPGNVPGNEARGGLDMRLPLPYSCEQGLQDVGGWGADTVLPGRDRGSQGHPGREGTAHRPHTATPTHPHIHSPTHTPTVTPTHLHHCTSSFMPTGLPFSPSPHPPNPHTLHLPTARSHPPYLTLTPSHPTLTPSQFSHFSHSHLPTPTPHIFISWRRRGNRQRRRAEIQLRRTTLRRWVEGGGGRIDGWLCIGKRGCAGESENV